MLGSSRSSKSVLELYICNFFDILSMILISIHMKDCGTWLSYKHTTYLVLIIYRETSYTVYLGYNNNYRPFISCEMHTVSTFKYLHVHIVTDDFHISRLCNSSLLHPRDLAAACLENSWLTQWVFLSHFFGRAVLSGSGSQFWVNLLLCNKIPTSLKRCWIWPRHRALQRHF